MMCMGGKVTQRRCGWPASSEEKSGTLMAERGDGVGAISQGAQERTESRNAEAERGEKSFKYGLKGEERETAVKEWNVDLATLLLCSHDTYKKVSKGAEDGGS